MKSKILLLVMLVSIVHNVWAHEIRPAYLELKQTGAETYQILWKTPGLGENMHLALHLELPARCVNLTMPRETIVNNSYTQRWTMKCAGGLGGDTIGITGLSGTSTDVLVRFEQSDGTVFTKLVTASSPLFVVATKVSVMNVVRTYTVLGVEHILMGIDHLLFILALLILTGGGWKLVKTVTAFTVSHSISLTLATLGYVHIPQKPVEAVIALSIVFVAAEILRARKGNPGISARAPWVVAFTFGLMHGLGFASGLSEAGLPNAHIPTALLFFSIGVEAGHFLFIGIVLFIMEMMRRMIPRLTPALQQQFSIVLFSPPYIIGSLAMFWVIQRIAAF